MADVNHEMQILASENRDLIHDVVFDYYGKRMATCSTDHNISVYALKEDGKWEKETTFEAHNAALWRVDWCHPEYGQILASCALDGAIVIWEEPVDQLVTPKQWLRRATLNESMQHSALAVQFAPKELDQGLKLACVYENGDFRLFEAANVMNLSNWAKIFEKNTGGFTASSLSWSTSRRLPAIVALGCNNPQLTSSSIPSPDSRVAQTSQTQHHIQVWRVEEKTVIEQKMPQDIVSVDQVINDVAFAPSLGRSFYFLACAYDNGLKLWKLRAYGENETFRIIPEVLYENTGSKLTRVSWNVTGTILAASSSNGEVITFAATDGVWGQCDKSLPQSNI